MKLHYSTVSPELLSVLKKLMVEKSFSKFRLVGGTALSLFLGHRKSIDIDLFTYTDYGTVDFKAIEKFLRLEFPYFDTNSYQEIGMGKSY